jgi:hypothetical protein
MKTGGTGSGPPRAADSAACSVAAPRTSAPASPAATQSAGIFFRLENTAHLARLQDRQFAHGLSHLDGLSPKKLGLRSGIAVLEQHGHDFFQVPFYMTAHK